MPGEILHVLHGHVLAQQIGDHYDAKRMGADEVGQSGVVEPPLPIITVRYTESHLYPWLGRRPVIDVNDVADYITNLKLQKLAYYSEAWYLGPCSTIH